MEMSASPGSMPGHLNSRNAKAAIMPDPTPTREAMIIDAAYGMVQGALGTFGDLNSDRGHRQFKRPEIQAAAMAAAKMFVDALPPTDQPKK